jgi:catechol 2,3-dioxygenase-like lactoylglutathione lyase family enzyme
MTLSTIDHINIQTRELERTCRFYEDVLGLRRGFRPEFPFPGAWLYAGDHAVVHLIGLTEKDKEVPKGSGSINHVAFSGSGISELLDRAKRAGADPSVRDVPGMKLRQVFLHDPNDILVEINFTGADAEGERHEVFQL